MPVRRSTIKKINTKLKENKAVRMEKKEKAKAKREDAKSKGLRRYLLKYVV